jgi:flagellar assembly protein FliH
MSRIIPKEQLAGYQRWQIGSFDKPTSPPSPSIAEDLPSPNLGNTVEATVQYQETVASIPFPTADDLARINDEARTEGYQRGYEEGLAAGQAEFTARTTDQLNQLSTMIGNLHVSLAHLDQHIADQLLDLSLEIASQVLRGGLKVNRELLMPTIREALGELPLHHGGIILHLNPADAEALSGALNEQLAHSGTRIVPDSAISEGGCLVKAGSSEIDASIEVRWRRVLEAIGLQAKEWLPNP